MAEIVSRSGRELVVRPRADVNTVGRWFAGIALVLGVLMAPLPVVLGVEELWLLQTVPGIFLLIGAIMAVLGRSWVLDTNARTLRHGGRQWSYDDFGAVINTTFIRRVRTQHGTTEQQVFQLFLLVRDRAREVMDTIDDLHQRLQQVLDEPEAGPDEDLQREVVSLLGRVEAAMADGAIRMFEHGSELAVWQATEALAKEMQVPVLDFCGDAMALRSPGELDLSLAEKLRRGLEKVGPEPEKPVGAERREEGDRLVLAFEEPKTLPLWVILGVPALLLVAGFWQTITANEPVLGVVLIVGAVVVLFPLMFIKIGKRRCILEVDPDEIRYSKEGSRRQRRMEIGKLEMLRVNTTLHTSLNWMSDERMEKIPMEEKAACWLRQGVESWLAERSLRLL